MNLKFTFFSALYLITAIISFFVAFIAWRRRGVRASKELFLLMLSCGIWAFFIIFETASLSLDNKILWSKIAYVGALSTPVFYFLFVLRFTGRDSSLQVRYILYLFIIPFLTFLFTITNEYHMLVWTGYAPISVHTNLTQYYHGIVYWIGNVGYNFTLLIFASVYLFKFILRQNYPYRAQARIIFVSSLCPWAASILYITGQNPVPGFDIVPQSLVFGGMLLAYAIFNNRLLDLVPIARGALLETIRDGILVLDHQDRIQEINKHACQILGLERRKAIGVFIETSGATPSELIEKIIGGNDNSICTIVKDNGKNTFRIEKLDLPEYPGSRLIIIRDLTDEEIRKSELVRSEDKYLTMQNMFKMMADNMEDYLWAKDLNKRFIFVNKTFCEDILKISNTLEPIGKDDLFFAQRERDLQPMNREWYTFGETSLDSDQIILDSRNPGRFKEEGFIHGVHIVLDVYKAPIFNSNEEMVGVVCSARDITSQEQSKQYLLDAKQRAEESNRIKSTFLSSLSHQIKNPINSITEFLDILQGPDIDTSDKIAYLSLIKKNNDRVLETLEDIIELSKLESKQTVLSDSIFNLNETMDYLFNSFKREADQKGLKLSYFKGLENNDALIKTDRNKLESVMIHLLKNALKYTHEGYVDFGYSVWKDKITFYVKDSGIGIPENKHRIIFNNFIQNPGNKSYMFEGAGLGLSIVKAFVDMLGGKIELISKVGSGSTFSFWFPYKSLDLAAQGTSKPINKM